MKKLLTILLICCFSFVGFAQVPTPDFQFFGNPCIGDTIKFRNESEKYVDLHWDFGDGWDTWSWEEPFHIYEESDQYSVKLTAYGLTGERRDKVKVLEIYPAPIVNIDDNKDTTEIYEGSSITFQAKGSFQYISWYDTPDFEGVDPLSNDKELTVYSAGVYYAYVIDEYGCTNLVPTQEVIVKPRVFDESTLIEISNNIVTANQDDANDFLFVENFSEYKYPIDIKIFNVWGDLVYSNIDYKNVWDGTSNDGKPLDTGTYYCVINSYGRKGIVTYVDLIR